MIEKIRKDVVLSTFLKNECCENGVGVTRDDDISDEDIVVIAVDDYYNSLNLAKRPPSPDCLIIVKCLNGGYALNIVELKDISTAGRFDLNNVLNKFETCLSDFIETKFRNLLFIKYKKVNIYFVSGIEIYKRDLGLKMEALINKRYTYMGRRYGIRLHKPTPKISKCY